MGSDLRTVRGRLALVTGAASGIGRATAALLAEDGATVAALDRSPPEAPPGGTAWSVDITDAERLAAVRAEIGEVQGATPFISAYTASKHGVVGLMTAQNT